jgi:hypothetical protein
LDEGRISRPGTQVLVGFQFSAVFQTAFETLPVSSQYANTVALGLVLFTLILLVWPATYHQIVERGEDTLALSLFTTKAIEAALPLFAVALGLDLYIATQRLAARGIGAVIGLLITGLALFFWYALGVLQRAQRRAKEAPNMETPAGRSETTPLSYKIKHVLTEARVVIPGAQALLGFQFAAMLQTAFDQLPLSSKYIHLGSLALMACSTILLMTPAAYHRIAEGGEETERFHRFASRMLLAAMVPLAAGVCGDFLVVVRKVTGSLSVATTAAAAMFILFMGLWFGFTFYRRRYSNAPLFEYPVARDSGQFER